MSDNDATDIGKAREELNEAVTEVVNKVGPTIRLVGSVIKETVQALHPLFADFNESLKKMAKAADQLKASKERAESVTEAHAEDARQRSERFP